jgi:hypothetical protein
MQQKIEKYLKYINGVLFGSILLAGYFFLLIGAYYSHPNAEDFSLAGTAYNEGIIMSTISLLISYDGRYFTNVLHGLNPLAFGLLEYHKWMAVFSMLFFTGAFYFFISAIFRETKWYYLLLFSLFIQLLCLGLSSSLVHELYWMVSSFVYFYSWIFWFLWVGCFLRYIADVKHRLMYCFFSNIFLFLAIGINEMFLVLNVISVGYLIYLDKVHNQRSVTHHIPIVITLLSSVLLFITSPGIIERWLYYYAPAEENIGYWGVFKNSIIHFPFEFIRILTENGVIIAVVVLIATRFIKLQIAPFEKLNQIQKNILFALCIVTLYFMTLAFYIPAGRLETDFPNRIYTSINTGMVICFVLFIPIFLRRYFSYNSPIIHFVALLIIGSGMFWGNTNIRLIKDEYQMGLLQRHNEEMTKRYEIIYEAKNRNDGQQIAVIDTLSAKPRSIYYGPDIEANRNPAYWNQAYEAFFNIDEIKLNGDTISK